MIEACAIVLAGGLGTRLRAVLGETPKVLAPIRGRPFLAYVLHNLRAQGIRRVLLSTGFQAERVQEALRECVPGGLEVQSIREPEPLGTGGAVAYVFEQVPELERAFVLNGDTFFTGSLRKLWQAHRNRPGAQATIALVRLQEANRYGTVRFDPETGRVEAFLEKAPASGEAVWINAGLYVLERTLLRQMPSHRPCSLERELFPRWIGQGVYAVPFPEAAFLDIGVPEDYSRAEAFLARYAHDI